MNQRIGETSSCVSNNQRSAVIRSIISFGNSEPFVLVRVSRGDQARRVIFLADPMKRYGPSVTDTQFWWVSFCSCAARLFPKWANKWQKCSRKTTLFSSNVEHVYIPPGRYKQRGTTPSPLAIQLSARLFSVQTGDASAVDQSPALWRFCGGWFLRFSVARQPLKGLARWRACVVTSPYNRNTALPSRERFPNGSYMFARYWFLILLTSVLAFSASEELIILIIRYCLRDESAQFGENSLQV